MNKANPGVDIYFLDGCGRCALGGTPQCKVHRWDDELYLLRKIMLETGLTEELKWGVPCYTFQKKNIVLIGAYNESCVLSFLKGALLKDEHKLLEKPGENSQSARFLRFTDVQKVKELETIIKLYVAEAVEIEKSGKKVDFKEKTELVYPQELLDKMEQDNAFKTAFEALTPGRKRGYNLFFTQPKQSQTRISRIEKCLPLIMQGKGLND